ncbi:DnaJ domain-containing protein [Corallococcus coralloides DSM 2259]|uniref:DnaJ domain-containing protein n=1 Tax=Corallococcus coralloides (strain ATCC 25202 / DSM 2259 / NBRC 100086 / M2) TaxID=1144275 RepID=H8MGF4_CORCM|nr:helix-turn-helix domain-containing protein [Corallococcus coralloides]AFE08607.1 DnaJ domain-containing protein [Corallococcus coralloides DSM 2259]
MKPFAQQTYYELLEVPPTATDAEIRAAHQRLMELYSPDSIAVYALGDPDQVEALRARMNEAMEMLTDADLRVEYDRSIGLSTERLAKAAATAEAAEAADKVDSAARVAEALATAAAALAKAAGAVDAERLEAESRLKAAASVNDNEGEAPRVSGPPGKSEERMRGEESKRQESSGMDAPGVPSEPVMVGGVAVVEAFRASFTRSLSFVYVPANPLRGQGRGATEAPAPAVDAKSPGAVEAQASSPVEATARTAASPVEAPSSAGSASVSANSAAESPVSADRVEALKAPVASTATEVPAPHPATDTRTVAATPALGANATPATTSAPEASATPAAPVATTPAQEASATPAAPVAATSALETSATPAAAETSAAPVAVTPAQEASATPAPVAATPAQEASATPAATPAPEISTTPPAAETSAAPVAAPPVPEAGATTLAPEASATPVAASQVPEAGSVAPSTEPTSAAAAVTTTQGESDPNPALDSSTTALVRIPATGASRSAVRPLTSRPIDSRPPQNGPTGPGTVKGPTVRKLGDAQVLAQDSAIATAESALAQVAAKVRDARPRGVDIPSDAEFNGELLRRVREARGLTIQQLADRTRISVRHLENVEADRYTALPTTVYLRGILMNLARELGLDPLRVSKSYLALFSEKPAKSGR